MLKSVPNLALLDQWISPLTMRPHRPKKNLSGKSIGRSGVAFPKKFSVKSLHKAKIYIYNIYMAVCQNLVPL